MKKHRSFISTASLLLLAAMLCPAVATAGIIPLNSDLQNESNSITGANVQIKWLYPATGSDPNTGWQPNGADYFWVSYADTGYPPNPAGDSGQPPQNWPVNVPDPIVLPNPNAPTATFYEYFALPYDINTGSIRIWADDTARVHLNKKNNAGDYELLTLLMDANPNQGVYCAAGSIGCTPAAAGIFDLGSLHLAAGAYQLQLDAYQRSSGPFGVLYSGSINSHPVPEPSLMLLLSISGIAIFFYARRLR